MTVVYSFQTRKSVVKLKEELSQMCEDSKVSEDQIDFSQWKNEIQQIALGKLSFSIDSASPVNLKLAKYFAGCTSIH